MWLIEMRTLSCAVALLSGTLLAGCKAKMPGAGETRLMWSMKHHVLVGDRGERNPMQSNVHAIAEGRETFSRYCAACHGLDGQNTGVPFADRMAPPVPSLASANVQQYTDGQLKWVIAYGIWPTGMPASRGMLSDDEMWSIITFIRHLPQAGTLGDPQMYSQ